MRPTVLALAALVLALGPGVPARAGDGGTTARAAHGRAAAEPDHAGTSTGMDDGGTAGAPGPDDAVSPKVAVPTLDLGGLGVPSAGGLTTGRHTDRTRTSGPTKVTFAATDLRLARRFDAVAKGGCRARGALQGFRLPAFPANVAPFDACLRLTATAGVVAHLVARILDPTGHVVATADGEVSFARAGRTQDFVIAWRGFPARHPGTYRLEVRLGGRDTGHFPIAVAAAHR